MHLSRFRVTTLLPVGRRVRELLRDRFCSGMRRHVYALITEPGRVLLRCCVCGHETSGVPVSTRGPR